MDFWLTIGQLFFLLTGLFGLITGLYGIYYKNLHIQGGISMWQIYVIPIKGGNFSKKLNRGMGTAILFIVFGLLVSIPVSFWMIYKSGLYSIQTILILTSIVLAWFWVVKKSESTLLNENLYQKAKKFKNPPPMLKKYIKEYEQRKRR
ncbi:MAG: hypothetical protein AAB546_04590 [Patescibacteria group bacterium]